MKRSPAFARRVAWPISERGMRFLGWTGAAINGQTGMQHAVWDPFVYRENGKRYLFYAVTGEHGIGLAELIP